MNARYERKEEKKNCIWIWMENRNKNKCGSKQWNVREATLQTSSSSSIAHNSSCCSCQAIAWYAKKRTNLLQTNDLFIGKIAHIYKTTIETNSWCLECLKYHRLGKPYPYLVIVCFVVYMSPIEYKLCVWCARIYVLICVCVVLCVTERCGEINVCVSTRAHARSHQCVCVFVCAFRIIK